MANNTATAPWVRAAAHDNRRSRPALQDHLPRGLHGLLDSAIRGHSHADRASSEREDREWALVDTREFEPGEYVIRVWTGADGAHIPVDRGPWPRRGGVIGVLTLDDGYLSVGPCPAGVDEGAGILLVGFTSILALPLPNLLSAVLGANWLIVLAPSAGAFRDPEMARVFSRVQALPTAEMGASSLLGRSAVKVPHAQNSDEAEQSVPLNKEPAMSDPTASFSQIRRTSRASGVACLALLAALGRAQGPAAIIGQTAGQASAVVSASDDDTSIRPYRFHVSDDALADLRQRLVATRWPEKETVSDESQGVQLATMQKLVRYWQTDYDWRKVEARLNGLPQFMTTIDGVDIHFIHVRSKGPNALPIIITHGWPGSVIELLKVIDPLTNPTAHGGRAEDAFDVVIPSMPGYGFSGKPTTTGWDPAHIARAWTVLMKRLGYTQFVAQGGDWGDAVSEQMALQAPPGLIGIHVNMPATVPADVARAVKYGEPAPSGLSAEEQHAYDQLAFFNKRGLGYAIEMMNKPQTLYGIADSPVGLASWMLDHDAASYALIARAFDGHEGGLTRDDVLDNITLYWLTGTAISSARLYWENKLVFFDPKGVSIPVAVSVFPDEIYAAPRTWAERAYPKLVYYHKLDKGGHFAAWEQPALFTDELRAAFRPLR